MPTLLEHILTIDRPNSRVLVSPAPTYDVTDPGDDFATPSWWRSIVYVDRVNSLVRLKMRACRLVFTCLTGTDNYTIESGTVGITSLYDIDSSRIGQWVSVDPMLPSTNGRAFDADLISVSGDSRGVYSVSWGFAGPLGVTAIPFGLKLISDNSDVAPVVGATYTIDFIFWTIS